MRVSLFSPISLLRHLRSSIPPKRTFCATAPIRDSAQKPASPEESQPLIYPPPPSQHHNDLASFLTYLDKHSLDPTKTVHTGTLYEYTTISSLSRLGFSLQRVGGRSDCGIDLIGVWSLPPLSHQIRVLVQCKVRQRPGPQHVRELEGAFIGAPVGWRGRGVVGVLVTDQNATKGIRDAIGRSKWPMVFMSSSREGKLSQFLWNARAEEEGGLGELGVGMRHGESGEGDKEVVLMWKGRSIEFEEKGGHI
ncbi:hypothetical protein QBC38DRAFT_244476 [Podospora fimiseda]|uniref:Required for respiratory growth protein 7, mitochondrial n=1 Tax=Podospora fimiseda TaxID=252190 RepID=A0AAN7BXJ2_9PEZI|nr:hypothetical protein QBC38DRAFT_244476 [Podospora fimiseda]